MWTTQLDGKQYALGVTDPNDAEGARRAHEKLVADLAAAVAGKLAAPPSVQSVAAAVAEFLGIAERKVLAGKIAEKSAANYRLHLTHLASAFGPRPINSLTADEVEAWADRPEWSSSTQHNTLGTVRQLLKHAGVSLRITVPPMESAGPETVLSDEQFAAVLVEVRRKQPGARGDLCDLLRVLRETGARPSEIARLTVEMVDWGNACVLLRKHKSKKKTGKDRLIVFNTAAMVVLEKQRKAYTSGLLFRTRWGNAYKPDTFNERLNPIGKALGFRVTAYGLRHTFATKALIAGIPEPVVAALLGHSSTAMVGKHYGHVSSSARTLRDAAERVSRAAG